LTKLHETDVDSSSKNERKEENRTHKEHKEKKRHQIKNTRKKKHNQNQKFEENSKKKRNERLALETKAHPVKQEIKLVIMAKIEPKLPSLER